MKSAELMQFARCACRPCRDRPFEGRIFLCYRHDEAPTATERLEDRLVRAFGSNKVFRDIRHIEEGQDYREAIRRELESCYAVVAVIGPTWLTAHDKEGHPKLDNPTDPVREELELALELETRGGRLIPVLLDRAKMPRAAELPDSLTRLAYRNAKSLPPAGFDLATDELIKRLRTPRRSRFSNWTDIREHAPVWALLLNALWRPLWANALLPVLLFVAALLIPGALWLIPVGVALYLALGVTTLFDLQQARCVHECLEVVSGGAAHDAHVPAEP